MKITELKDEDQIRFDECAKELITIIDNYFPEIRKSRSELEKRVFMTLYLELINAGFFKNE